MVPVTSSRPILEEQPPRFQYRLFDYQLYETRQWNIQLIANYVRLYEGSLDQVHKVTIFQQYKRFQKTLTSLSLDLYLHQVW